MPPRGQTPPIYRKPPIIRAGGQGTILRGPAPRPRGRFIPTPVSGGERFPTAGGVRGQALQMFMQRRRGRAAR